MRGATTTRISTTSTIGMLGLKRSLGSDYYGGCRYYLVGGNLQKVGLSNEAASNRLSTKATPNENQRPAEEPHCDEAPASGARSQNGQTMQVVAQGNDSAVHTRRVDESIVSTAALQSTKASQLAGRRRLPPNFVKEVLIPHLEQWIYDSRKTYPAHLIELVVAYSQMPVINPSLCITLADMVIHRLEDFSGPELIKMLWPLVRLRPHDENLFAHLAIELEEHFLELSTLHLIAIVRVFAQLRRNDQQQRFLEKLVIPRLQSDIARYDTEELSALLVSLAAVPVLMDTAGNVPLLAAIVPLLESRYDETPLLTSIINLNALCRLRVFHRRLLLLVASDLNDPFRVRNLLPKYIAVAVWTFARYGLLSRVYPKALHDLVCANLGRFNAREFARLCQALPEESDIPARLTRRFLEELPSMSRDHFTFFVLGCTRRGFFPREDQREPIRDAGLRHWDADSENFAARTEEAAAAPPGAQDLDQRKASSSKQTASATKFSSNDTMFYKLDFRDSSFMATSEEVVVSTEREALDMEKYKPEQENVATNGPEVPNSDQTQSEVPNSDQTQSEVPNSDQTQREVPNSDQTQSGVPNSDQTQSEVPNSDQTQTNLTISREKVLNECLEYIDTYEDEVSTAEIQRLTRIFVFSPKQQYAYIIKKFPSSWEAIVHEILYMGK